MNVYIKSYNNFPVLHEGVICLEEFKNRISDIYLYEEFDEIPLNRNTLLIAPIDDTKRFFKEMGWKVDMSLTFPLSIPAKYWGRYIQRFKKNTQNKYQLELFAQGFCYPLFIKPLNVKEFEPGIIKSSEELIQVLSSFSSNFPFIISEVVNFISEWRAYVVDRKLVGVFNYLGDFKIHPDYEFIENLIKDFKNSPISYCIDVGICEDNTTKLVECNDFWSLGNYGLSPKLYVNGITTRWREILTQNPVIV